MIAYSSRVRILSLRLLLLGAALCIAGCAGRPLPKFQKPIARAEFQSVRTTAYTHSEADHLKYGRRNALLNPMGESLAEIVEILPPAT